MKTSGFSLNSEFSLHLARITESYPTQKQLEEVFRKGVEADRKLLARQWLSEGIPFAFKKCPAVYESMRSWLSKELNVEAKEIHLFGSARLGWSLKPGKRFGAKFNPKSDLDLFIVSESLFTSMCENFNCWFSDFITNKISPINNEEKRFWEDHQKRGPKIISRGFIDLKMIPTRGNYDSNQIHQKMSELKNMIKVANNVHDISKASIRCYESWKDWERQACINIQASVEYVSTP